MHAEIYAHGKRLVSGELRHRRWVRVITALSCAVVFCTTYALILPAITLERPTYCGLEEHTHTAECYEKVLVCGLQEQDSHVHGEGCYENRLVCTKPEHVHTLACYSDPQADVETAETWERTLPASLSGSAADDLAAVASSQLGYTESSKNYTVAADGVSTNGYSRYGAWYGDPYADWNALFASFCLQYAGVSEETVPRGAEAGAWAQQLAQSGLLCVPQAEAPAAGSLVFFDRDADGAADHVGIVSAAAQQQDITVLTVIEGDREGAVAGFTCDAADSFLFGFVPLPGAAPEAENTPQAGPAASSAPEGASAATETPAPSASPSPAPVLAQAEMTAAVYTDASCTVRAENADTITVSGLLPVGASVRAVPMSAALPDASVLWAYDITVVTADGQLWEPAADNKLSVSVQTARPANLSANQSVEVYYQPEDGDPQPLASQTEDSATTFEAEHFSVYLAGITDWIFATDFNTFSSAMNSGAAHIRLMVNVDIPGGQATTYTISSSDYVIDLNGHYIGNWWNTAGPLFHVVSGGSLTIADSQAGTGGGAAGSDAYFTYEITTSNPTGAASGATTESTQSYTVSDPGRIICNTQDNSDAPTNPIVQVDGGTFTLQSGVMGNCRGRAINMVDGTVNLEGGYINNCNCTQNGTLDGGNTGNGNFGGAVRTNGGALNLSGTVLCNNNALNGGAIYATNTNVSMTGGAIACNHSTRSTDNWYLHSDTAAYRCGGGGIFCDGQTTFEMSGGTITHNTTADDDAFDGGGGVFISGMTHFTMSGGQITDNDAQGGGGGVHADVGAGFSFVMTGGFICDNRANVREGGGVLLGWGGTGSIIAGSNNNIYINNNSAQNTQDWGGGGVFCSGGATLRLMDALVTNNHAGGFGGGVAGCSTGKVYVCIQDGSAIYDNTAGVSENHLSGGSSVKPEDHDDYNNETFRTSGSNDFYCAHESVVEGGMLGGGSANWSGSVDYTPVTGVAKETTLHASRTMGLSASPTDADKAAAQNRAHVFINNNTSNTHGGGIMCNGDLLIGRVNQVPVGSELTLSGTKALTKNGNSADFDGRTFTFQMKASDDSVVSTGTSDADGAITFNAPLRFSEEQWNSAPGEAAADGTKTFTYFLTENTDLMQTGIQFDNTRYSIAVNVLRTDTNLPFTDDNGNTIQKAVYTVQSVTVQKSTDGGTTWADVSSVYSSTDNGLHGALSISGTAATFTNNLVGTVSVTVNKIWMNGTANVTENTNGTITVNLYRKKIGEEANQTTLYATGTVSPGNSWTCTFSDLPKSYIEKGVMKDYVYTVAEANGESYTPDVIKNPDGSFTITNHIPTYTLPDTGGIGTAPFLLCGLALMGMTVFIRFGLMRKRRRESG
jgi:predicted outer membrane repeat protein